MILSTLICVLGLKEQIAARHHSRLIRSGQPFANSRFEVMPPLIGGIDRAKSLPQRQFGQARSAIFLPGGSIKKKGRGQYGRHRIILSRSSLAPLLAFSATDDASTPIRYIFKSSQEAFRETYAHRYVYGGMRHLCSCAGSSQGPGCILATPAGAALTKQHNRRRRSHARRQVFLQAHP